MTLGTVAGIDAAVAFLGFGTAPAEQVYGPGKHFATGGFHAADQFFSGVPGDRHVELKPGRGAKGLGNLFNRSGSDAGKYLQMMFGASGAGSGQFAFRGMESFLTADGADVDGRFVLFAEEFDGHVDFGDVDEAAGAELDVTVGFVVETERGVVFHAGRHVAPVGGWKGFARGFLKVHDVESVIGIADDSWRNTWEALRPRFREQRTACEEAEKIAAVARCGIAHGVKVA